MAHMTSTSRAVVCKGRLLLRLPVPGCLLHECVDTLGAQMLSLGVEGTHMGLEVENPFHAAEATS